MPAMDVGIRELRAGLSRYVEQVKQGEEIVVTEHGRPVARLVPMNGERKIDRLIREGVVIPARSRTGWLSGDAHSGRGLRSVRSSSSSAAERVLRHLGVRQARAREDRVAKHARLASGEKRRLVWPPSRCSPRGARRSPLRIERGASATASYAAALESFDRLWAEIDGLELTESLARRAGELADGPAPSEATTRSTSLRPRRSSTTAT